MNIELTVNGKRMSVEAEAGTSLLSALRDRLHLTGAKYGCGEAQCGACTVLVDGKAARSCVTPLESVAGKRITTIEGLATGEELHPVQRAFAEEVAMQCGYCTAGMILSAAALLERNPNPTDQDIVRSMDGNICRCGTYPRIMAAIRRAAAALREGRR